MTHEVSSQFAKNYYFSCFFDLSTGSKPISEQLDLALQLPFLKISESMGNHNSKIVGAGSVD